MNVVSCESSRHPETTVYDSNSPMEVRKATKRCRSRQHVAARAWRLSPTGVALERVIFKDDTDALR